ncbi:MAG: RHS repeat-associated core domain-containing protein, partial [Verrucomicrobia bacterium]|nr:RHS repeat-associated core domain-containing protein [Verrucomicrobiota bacterium]
MRTNAFALAGASPLLNRRLEFQYDYPHRRVEKKVLTGAGFATVALHRRYLYDGWNVIAEYAVTSLSPLTLTPTRTYTWGLDIARSLGDAGGVGALLQIADHSTGKAYLPAYDGNGNVAALFDAADGTVAAAYEYSPYGEFLRCEGTYARENSFRFSTKFTDDETGLVYYGRRYYSPSQGRFFGRDPIEEQGGLNLYGFCYNNSINCWDKNGCIVVLLLAGRVLAGAVGSVALDIGVQLTRNGGNWRGLSLGNIALSAAAGAAGYTFVSAGARIVSGYRVVQNATNQSTRIIWTSSNGSVGGLPATTAVRQAVVNETVSQTASDVAAIAGVATAVQVAKNAIS